jgi:hypothetical protein
MYYANGMCGYARCNNVDFIETLNMAAAFHDLGKLCTENQEVLSGRKRISKGVNLPINHVDAGATHLYNECLSNSSMLVYAHHRGLPDVPNELVREDLCFRDGNLVEKTNSHLNELIEVHKELNLPVLLREPQR